MVEVTKVEDISILHLFGEITMLEVEMIEKIFQSLKKCNMNKIILDLARVDHLHFEAVKKWSREAVGLRLNSGDLKLVNITPKTRDVLRFAGADQCFDDFGVLSDAILSFLKNPFLEHPAGISLDRSIGQDDEMEDERERRGSASPQVH